MKKLAALSANLVAVKGTGVPSPDMHGRSAASQDQNVAARPFAIDPLTSIEPDAAASDEIAGAPLNFRVSGTFRREFKVYAAQHGLKLNELLRQSFEAYRRIKGS